MAFISNQWLRGFGLRDKTHSPVQNKLIFDLDPNELRRKAGLKFRMILQRSDGNHHIVRITPTELPDLIEFLAANSNPDERLRFARILQPE